MNAFNLRIVERKELDLDPDLNGWVTVRMSELKKGDVFRFSDETLHNDEHALGGEHLCESDAYETDGVWGVNVHTEETPNG